ncbi:MAG: universal stress protein [Planctomycetota bacterium]|jgi:nucleotide-binding universal stress UspA family protein
MIPAKGAESNRLRTIIAATDFSSNADTAFAWALQIARRHGAELVIVHAVEADSDATVTLHLQEEITRGLGQLEGQARRDDVGVRSVYRVGRAWEVIPEVEREVQADLIVVGMRGHTPYSRIFLGSTADRVVRSAQAPVITVGPDATLAEPDIRTVLVATDFSDEATLAMNAVVRLLAAVPGRKCMTLLHACHVPLEYGIDGAVGAVVGAIADREAGALNQLERMAAPLRSDSLHVQAKTRVGYPAAEIEREAKSLNADLVAVGTRGRTGLRYFLLGSIAERVLRHAPCPVLTVRHPSTTDPVHLARETEVLAGS